MCTPAALALPRPPSRSLEVSNTRPIGSSAGSTKLGVAGALGIEPRPSVLETDGLTVEHHAPSQTLNVNRENLNASGLRYAVFPINEKRLTINVTSPPCVGGAFGKNHNTF